MGVLVDMKNTYAMVDSTGSARFAVGHVNGSVSIFDMKTATLWQEFVAFDAAVTAIAFDQKGKRLAVYSRTQNALRVFQLSTSLFGVSASCKMVKDFSVKAQAISKLSTRALLQDVQLLWDGERKLRVSVGAFTTEFPV